MVEVGDGLALLQLVVHGVELDLLSGEHLGVVGKAGAQQLVCAISCILWLVYGVYFRNLSILFGNSISLFFTLLLVFFKHYFQLLGEPPRPVPAPKG